MGFHEAMQSEMAGQRALEAGLEEGLGLFAGYAQDERLRAALLDARGNARTQGARLDTACESLGWHAGRGDSKILQGVQWQARETLADAPPSPLTDALIIATVQKILHLEIATYGTLRAIALRMGEDGIAYLLDRNLDEDKATDARLTEIAETGVNQAAVDDADPMPRWKTRR